MIIQHPDGSYECCLLPPTVILWLRTVLRRARALLLGGELCSGCERGDCS